jgi:hypothetical protein
VMYLISKSSCDRSCARRTSRRSKILTKSLSIKLKKRWRLNANRRQSLLKKLKSKSIREI